MAYAVFPLLHPAAPPYTSRMKHLILPAALIAMMSAPPAGVEGPTATWAKAIPPRSVAPKEVAAKAERSFFRRPALPARRRMDSGFTIERCCLNTRSRGSAVRVFRVG